MDVNEYVLYSHIGATVNQAREALNITQDELAAACGLTRTSITNLEAGRQRPPITVLYKVCKALSIPLAEILPDVNSIVSGEPLSAQLTRAERKIQELQQEIDRLRRAHNITD